MDILSVFCRIDDFCQVFEKFYQQRLISDGKKHRNRKTNLSLSEVMTILVMYHASSYKNLKAFYLKEICRNYRTEFLGLVSYQRFVQLQSRCVMPLFFYLLTCRGEDTGISFIDATAIKVCHNLRIPAHQVFRDCAKRDRASTGWYYGFKLHLAVNEKGEILGFYVTAANVDERKPTDWITKDLKGVLVGDKGYISKDLFAKLMQRGLRLITKLRKNMKNKFISMKDKLLLRKRAIIETVNDQLKNISDIEHSRHRSVWNFLGNIAAGLIAYSLKEKKPTVDVNLKGQLVTQPVIL